MKYEYVGYVADIKGECSTIQGGHKDKSTVKETDFTGEVTVSAITILREWFTEHTLPF